MSFDPVPILNAVISHAQASGCFERVNGHEPKNPPTNGLTAAVWVQKINAVARASGLAATSCRLLLVERIYTNMLAEPQDAIDPNVTTAAATLMVAYSGDFQLGDTAAYLDLLGAHGIALDATAGYLPQADKTLRVMDITIPVIIDDVFPQEA